MSLNTRNVYVTRIIPQAGMDILQESLRNVTVNVKDHILTRHELQRNIKGIDGLLCLLTDRIDAEALDAAGPQLKVVANHAVGFDNIDMAAATARGIMVTNTPGVLTDATADFTWALLLATARHLVGADKFARDARFDGWGPMMYLGGDITGCTLGIVGAGRIGSAVAAKSVGFKMRVLYCSNSRNLEIEKQTGAAQVELDLLLAESDYVSVHVPLSDRTRHMFDGEAFRKMKKTAYFVNTSRGPVVDEAALVGALLAGEIAGAGLDVYEHEPKIHPGLFKLDNVVLAPHIASATVATRTKMAVMAATNLVAALKGERPPNLLNPEVLGN